MFASEKIALLLFLIVAIILKFYLLFIIFVS
nr:MAG TPA: Triple QxxK/R motif-containing protein family [Caudoviricetes sp.]